MTVLNLDKEIEKSVNSQLKVDDDLINALNNLDADSILNDELKKMSGHQVLGSGVGKSEFKKRYVQAKAKVEKVDKNLN